VAAPRAAAQRLFSGWPKDAIDFFDGLEENNNRDWFQENKARYDRAVREPMELFLASVEGEFGHSHLFRPNRDTRFAKDKSPYKTNIAAVIGGDGGPIMYVHLDQSGLIAASGHYMMAPDQISRFRAAVAEDTTGEALVGLLATASKAKMTKNEPALKRVPAPYPKEHPRGELLRHKSMTLSRSFGLPAWLHTAKAREQITAAWRASAGLNGWLAEHVGPSDLPDSRR
jgi:uncharacterized protein (TIGR02453 family)